MNTARRREINQSRGSTIMHNLWQELEPVLDSLEEDGWYPMITQAYRSMELQAAIYAQGREPLDAVNELRKIAGEDPIEEKDNIIVTNARAGSSMHNFARAVDIVNYPDDKQPEWENMDFYKALWAELEPIGWKWGGNFTKPDYGHYEK